MTLLPLLFWALFYITDLSVQDKTEEPSLEEKKDSQNRTEAEGGDQSKILKLFSFLQTLTATFASFVHGGNDVRYEV
jgi:phosphate/sulfate permease